MGQEIQIWSYLVINDSSYDNSWTTHRKNFRVAFFVLPAISLLKNNVGSVSEKSKKTYLVWHHNVRSCQARYGHQVAVQHIRFSQCLYFLIDFALYIDPTLCIRIGMEWHTLTYLPVSPWYCTLTTTCSNNMSQSGMNWTNMCFVTHHSSWWTSMK